MKWLLSIALVCLGKDCLAQYYYYDVVAAHQTELQNALLKKNKVKKVIAVSYENDNTATENFKLEQTILQNADLIITNSTDAAGVSTETKSNFNNSRITKNTDSSNRIATTTTYQYDDAGRLKIIQSVSEDAFMNSRSQEQHQWFYESDRPSYMLRIKDKKDTTRINFVYDEKGNLAEEIWRRGTLNLEHWYYYYNAGNQVSDIVRYNTKAKRMLPDFLFEYDEAGRVSQLTQVPSGISSYLVWKYIFNETGLKNSESCFNKQKKLVGRIVYTYQ